MYRLEIESESMSLRLVDLLIVLPRHIATTVQLANLKTPHSNCSPTNATTVRKTPRLIWYLEYISIPMSLLFVIHDRINCQMFVKQNNKTLLTVKKLNKYKNLFFSKTVEQVIHFRSKH